MLFNSYQFIFYFLPVVLSGFFFLCYFKKREYLLGWLIAASVWFYSDFKIWHLWVLLFELFSNFFIAKKIFNSNRRVIWLMFGVGINISILAWFKYAHFFNSINFLKELIPGSLPLGISFYTFQLIAYLVDIYRNKIKPAPVLEYLFFILFFPQLIAGPIVHYLQISQQLNKLDKDKCCKTFSLGLLFFTIGLVKKVWLADTFANFADKSFNLVQQGVSIDFLTAWSGVFSYSFQIYFDFCAYSEMAIGLGLMFGLRLPVNFLSPYKAEGFKEFWQRWHITLSSFLRDYLYIPLGGNRKGSIRKYFNIIFVMTIAGAWHGSGLNFLLWGVSHGILIVFNHIIYPFRWLKYRWLRQIKILFTFIMVTLLWVLFRSDSVDNAVLYYKSLFDYNSLQIITFDFKTLLLHWNQAVWFWIAAGLLVVWFLPNIKEFLKYDDRTDVALIKPGFFYGFIGGVLFWIAMKMLFSTASKSFIYFIF